MTQHASTAPDAPDPGTTADLIAEAAAELNLAERDPESATPHTRRVAEILVELRERFLTRDGDPDYLGRSAEYRQTYGDILFRAGITEPAHRVRVSTRLRRHVHNIQRQRYSTDLLESLGLGTLSPVDRDRARRQETEEFRRMIHASTLEDRKAMEAELSDMSEAELVDHVHMLHDLVSRLRDYENLAEIVIDRKRHPG
jgi:hypothetical protein